MLLNEYQTRIKEWEGGANVPHRDRLMICALGIAGEAGEVADSVKKRMAHPHQTITNEMLALELGDVLWYIAAMADALGYTLNEIAWMNLKKLQKRYPNGFPKDSDA